MNYGLQHRLPIENPRLILIIAVFYIITLKELGSKKRPAKESMVKRRIITICCMTFLICLSCIEVTPADEPAERFLQALRENGYYDIALDYLESISDSPAVSDDFKKILPFEKAETLIKSTAGIRNIDEWEKRLDEAQSLLAESAKLADTPEFLSRAQRNQGNLLYRRARVYMKRADDDRLTVGEQQKLMRLEIMKVVTRFAR